jgi:ATP-dependent DNA helicase DinG
MYAGVMSEPAVAAPRTFAEAQVALAAALPNYESRPEQVLLATNIEKSWEDGTILIGQAGTGTGKSLAGLIPAILSGERTIYATATKALQSQIMGKDLPFLEANLGVPFTYAMLQGRSNYFCHMRATETQGDNPMIGQALAEFSKDDDAAEVMSVGLPVYQLDGLRENLPTAVDNASWSKMTITADECPRKKCPFYSVCRFQNAKAKADVSQVVVANHALLALDGVVAQSSGGFASILGDYHHVIVDECHELAEFITNALTKQQSPGTYRHYTSELRSVSRHPDFEETDTDSIETLSSDIVVASSRFFDAFEPGRVRHRAAVDAIAVVEPLIGFLQGVQEILLENANNSDDKHFVARLNKLSSRTGNLLGAVTDFLLKPDTEMVRLFEIEKRGNNDTKVLRVIPVSVAQWSREWLWTSPLRERPPTMISATVLVDNRPDFIVKQLGLDTAPTTVVDVGSPFDFTAQSRLYVPAHIPEPTQARRQQWELAMNPLIEQLVNISEGRALLLFTSAAQMNKAWDAFAHKLTYPCRKQGDASVALLTTWFREETNSVLFATRSFFTGIDIQGDSLSLVVIDKLPFPVPTDPVFEARCEDVERRGGNSFGDLTVPMMSLVLQQAFGRLIRTKSDRGVVAIMDPRLMTKGYGTKIRRSIPAPYTDNIDDIEAFFESASV